MMQRSLTAVILVSFALIGSIFAISRVSLERDKLHQKEGVGLVMPSQVAQIIALEFKGLFADAIFSKAMTYYGGKLMRGEKTTKEEWDWIYRNMDTATDLDNYFLDPYYFGATNLVWGANKVKEANLLLEKAFKYRGWDWTIPFYLGFNYFYFLQDNEKAAFYLMESAKRGAASALIPILAARLAYQGKRTENAIIFLQEIIRKTDDETLKKAYETRLNALKSILFLERAAAVYQERFKRRPETVDDLTAKNIIKEVPKDPYGGRFYIDKDGGVKTTSELR